MNDKLFPQFILEVFPVRDCDFLIHLKCKKCDLPKEKLVEAQRINKSINKCHQIGQTSCSRIWAARTMGHAELSLDGELFGPSCLLMSICLY